jgi:hypothetical protein
MTRGLFLAKQAYTPKERRSGNTTSYPNGTNAAVKKLPNLPLYC